MAGPPYDGDAPSESFLGLAEASDVLQVDLYSYLTEGLRQIDEQGAGILRRLLSRQSELLNHMQQKVWRLAHIYEPHAAPAALLLHLLALVGFDPKSGWAWRVVSALDEDARRQLLQVAAGYWKTRGRKDTLAGALRSIAGVNPLVLDWHDVRSIIDSTPIGWTGAFGTGFLSIYEPDTEPTTPEYAPYYLDVYVMLRDGLNTDLVETICQLARPVCDVFTVHYVDFLETFFVEPFVLWSVAVAGSGYVAHEYVASDDPSEVVMPGVSLGHSATLLSDVPGDDQWEELYIRTSFRGVADSGGGSVWIARLFWYAADEENCYFVSFTETTATLGKLVAGTPTSLDSVTGLTLGVDVPHGVTVYNEALDSGGNLIRVYLDDDLILESSGDATYERGKIGLANGSGSSGDVVFHAIMAWQQPQSFTTIDKDYRP